LFWVLLANTWRSWRTAFDVRPAVLRHNAISRYSEIIQVRCLTSGR
jgi:hypothetical protein